MELCAILRYLYTHAKHMIKSRDAELVVPFGQESDSLSQYRHSPAFLQLGHSACHMHRAQASVFVYACHGVTRGE